MRFKFSNLQVNDYQEFSCQQEDVSVTAGKFCRVSIGEGSICRLGLFSIAQGGKFSNLGFSYIENGEIEIRWLFITGDTVKPHTWYTLDENNEIVEVC